jgi:dTDP-D-glucose 4,6-dehydratase
VDISFGNSISFTQNNVLGTHVLLEAARERGTQIKFEIVFVIVIIVIIIIIYKSAKEL